MLVSVDVPMNDRASEFSLSVLDLCPVLAGGSAADAFRRSIDLARHTEKLGYHRYWVAEHHNMPGIASAATSVVIGHIAAGTSTIRVGSEGIMLLNHAPLVIAEQFGTLESLYPGRIDLGLGRAPGTDQATMRVLRRNLDSTGEEFPQKTGGTPKLLEAAVARTACSRCAGSRAQNPDLAPGTPTRARNSRRASAACEQL
jgi:luciferase family oxidoreductase group 1